MTGRAARARARGRHRALRRLCPWPALLAFVFLIAGCGGEEEAARYACRMHPVVESDAPGDCSICGMRLAPAAPILSASAQAGGREAAPDHRADRPADGERAARVPTEAAAIGRLTRAVRAPGVVVADPERIHHVVLRAEGWIDRLDVKASGAAVRRGQPLFTLGAPDLVPTQEIYVRLLREAARGPRTPGEERAAEEQRAAVRARLERFGLQERFIADLERGLEPSSRIPFFAQVSGIVALGEVFEGRRVEPGLDLMTITDLSRVWVEADLFEADVPHVREGQEGEVALLYDPGVRVAGVVIGLSPFLDPSLRSTKVRIRCRNDEALLRPGMSAVVVMEVDLGEGVIVPSSAVVDTGMRRVVYVERGEGRFEPREVTVGPRAEGRATILSGIVPGERVAVPGNFLVDSESPLKGARTGAGGPEPRP